jgi:A/G-specific adenine glycosylase
VQKHLWALSEQLTPDTDTAVYNQGMMDLGSLVCKRGVPKCPECPLVSICQAHAQGRERELPEKKSASVLPVRSCNFLILRDKKGAVLLEKRPPSGIWGGLWSFPEYPDSQDPVEWCADRLGIDVGSPAPLPERQHRLTHCLLEIAPLAFEAKNHMNRVMDGTERVWYKPSERDARGLASPVTRILAELNLPERRENEPNG